MRNVIMNVHIIIFECTAGLTTKRKEEHTMNWLFYILDLT